MMYTPVITAIRGVKYRSMSEASRKLGVSVSTIWGAAERGTLDQVGLGRRKPGHLDGVPFASVAEAARQMGVPLTTLHYRIKTGKHEWIA